MLGSKTYFSLTALWPVTLVVTLPAISPLLSASPQRLRLLPRDGRVTSRGSVPNMCKEGGGAPWGGGGDAVLEYFKLFHLDKNYRYGI